MNKIIIAIAIISVLFINQTANAYTNENTKKEQGYISLNATETKDIDPDIATITFTVENAEDTAQKASEINNKISDRTVKNLKLILNNETDKIKTTGFSVRPVYSTTVAGKRTIKNYTATNSITVITKDITKVSKLIDTAISAGANRTNNLQFGIENAQNICKSIYPQMIKELKKEAEILAEAAGTSLNGLKHLNASCNADSVATNGRFYLAKSNMDTAEEAAVSTPIEAGKAKIRVYINADFYVK